MSGGTSVVKYTRVKSSVLAPVSLDPVLQHMSAWHLCQHERIIQRAQSRERAHVNPGRCTNNKRPSRQAHVASHFSKEYDKASKLLSQLHRPPALNISLTSSQHRTSNCMSSSPSIHQNPGKLRKHNSSEYHQPILRWQAHAASHARQIIEQQPSYHPQILDTKANSRLLQSRNYQQPRRKTRQRISNGALEVCEDKNIVPKMWPIPSVSSSSGDSAYEPGGSSPPSRGSTPRHLQECESRTSSSTSSESVPSHESPHQGSNVSLLCASPEPMHQTEQDQVFTPCKIQSLPRNNDLDYALFENELMSEILTAGVVTNAAVKQLCRSHLAVNHGRLEQGKMEDIVNKLQETLDIPADDELDMTCFGLGGLSRIVSIELNGSDISPCQLSVDHNAAEPCKMPDDLDTKSNEENYESLTSLGDVQN